MVNRNVLGCCALAQLRCSDSASIHEIEWAIEKMKREGEHWCYNNNEMHGLGQKACFVIVSPFEDRLEANLKKLKFKLISTFSRRTGYPQTGDLKMYFLKW